MHPEILRELSAQRGREMRARARQAKLSRLAILAGRRRNQADVVNDFIIPAIPDYVDGSFRPESANTGPTASQATEAGQAPAHHAA